MEYELAKDDFQIYQMDNYKYSDAKNLVDCGYMNTATTAAAMAAKKQSMAGQAVASKKQVIETGWKYTEPRLKMIRSDPADSSRRQTDE
jgi:hypothetical protein